MRLVVVLPVRLFGWQSILFASEVLIRHPYQLHCSVQVRFALHDGRDVAGLRRPTMRPRFVSGQNLLLIGFGQANVAMSAAMDVHEHCRSNEKRVLVNSRILPLGYTRQSENSFPQFLMKFV